MADEEYNWLDDAFDDSKPDPLAKASEVADGDGYDWLDDAFDESKEDPLAKKGMTGCSRLAVLFGALGVIVVLALFAFIIFSLVSALNTGASV